MCYSVNVGLALLWVSTRPGTEVQPYRPWVGNRLAAAVQVGQLGVHRWRNRPFVVRPRVRPQYQGTSRSLADEPIMVRAAMPATGRQLFPLAANQHFRPKIDARWATMPSTKRSLKTSTEFRGCR